MRFLNFVFHLWIHVWSFIYEINFLQFSTNPPLVVVDGNNPHFQWPGVSPGIIRYSFMDLGIMEGWVGRATREYMEIFWYGLHVEWNTGFLYGSTLVYPLCYNCLGTGNYVHKLSSHLKSLSQFLKRFQDHLKLSLFSLA